MFHCSVRHAYVHVKYETIYTIIDFESEEIYVIIIN